VVTADRLNASFIVPSVFDTAVAPAVAEAVRRAAEEGLAPAAATAAVAGR
jgi:malate dehydrogenase (oxaloacetate-decarboxylating)